MIGRARAIALPYRWIEGSGVLATALAQGVPPVVTAVGTFPELCTEYDLCAPVAPDDPAGFADALVRTLTDPAARARALRRHAARAGRADLGAHGADDARRLRASARGRGGSLAQTDRATRSRASRGTLRGMRLRPGLLALLVCALAPCAPAMAASPPGTLAELAGAGGCVSQQAPLGCTAARGLDDARAVALSPDGKTLYAVARRPRA